MKKIISKTNYSLLIIALCVILFCGLFAINNLASKKQPAIAYEVGSSATLRGKISQWNDIWWTSLNYDVENLIITNTFDINTSTGDPIDVSEAKDGSLNAYKVDNGDGTYNCFIYADVEKIYAPADTYWLFSNYSSSLRLKGVKTITFENNCFDTSKVTDMGQMFQNSSSLKTIIGIDNWDTSNATSMFNMFYECNALTTITDLSNWDVSNVTSMGQMFYKCGSLTSLDLSKWDTSNVTSMSSMFENCSSLISLNISTFDTSNVTSMKSMFTSCSSLTSLNVSNFDISNVTDMSYMFQICSDLIELDLTSKLLENGNMSWSANKVTKMTSMFMQCSSLKSLDLSSFDSSNVTTMAGMFEGCVNLEHLDLGNFNTSKVTDMSLMFVSFSSANGNISQEGLLIMLQSAGVQVGDLSIDDELFYTKLSTALGMTVEGDETSAKAQLEKSFGGTIEDGYSAPFKLTTLDISSFVINSGTKTGGMLSGLKNLQTLISPTNCNAEILLPNAMVEQGTENEHTTLSSSSNGKTLVLASSETPSTGFVDEQLLPAIAIAFASIVAFVVTINLNKKKKNLI